MNTKGIAIAAAMVLSGCTFNVARVTPDTPPPANEESVIVLGVTPSEYAVVLFPGSVTDGTFSQALTRNAVVNASPVDGYVVAKITGGDTVALMKTFRVDKDERGVPFSSMGVCGSARAMVFEVPKGKILYIGDIEYQSAGNKLVVRYSQDFDRSKKHIDAMYPQLSARMEHWEYELLPTSTSCTATTTIPIVLPRR